MSLDEHYTIDTPEQIDVRYAVAGIGSRFLAAIVDTALLLLLQVALVIVAVVLSSVAESRFSGSTGDTASSLIIAGWAVLSFVFFWGFYIFFELFWNGQTPGKRMISLRVVRDGGRPVTFVASAIRNLIRFVDFLPGLYGLGVLTMFIDRRARRLGDLAGGTLVVKDRGVLTLDKLVEQTAQQQAQLAGATPTATTTNAATGAGAPDDDTPQENPIPNLHLLSQDDYNLVQEFLRRRKEFSTDSRKQLGTQLATRMSERLGLSLDMQNAELFLEHLAQSFRQLHQG